MVWGMERHYGQEHHGMQTNNPTDTTEPLTVTIPTATARTGLSRSSLYRLAVAGSITFRKAGRTTLIEWPTLKAHVAALPVADLRGAA